MADETPPSRQAQPSGSPNMEPTIYDPHEFEGSSDGDPSEPDCLECGLPADAPVHQVYGDPSLARCLLGDRTHWPHGGVEGGVEWSCPGLTANAPARVDGYCGDGTVHEPHDNDRLALHCIGHGPEQSAPALTVNDTVTEGDWCECPGTTRRHFRTASCPTSSAPENS